MKESTERVDRFNAAAGLIILSVLLVILCGSIAFRVTYDASSHGSDAALIKQVRDPRRDAERRVDAREPAGESPVANRQAVATNGLAAANPTTPPAAPSSAPRGGAERSPVVLARAESDTYRRGDGVLVADEARGLRPVGDEVGSQAKLPFQKPQFIAPSATSKSDRDPWPLTTGDAR